MIINILQLLKEHSLTELGNILIEIEFSDIDKVKQSLWFLFFSLSKLTYCQNYWREIFLEVLSEKLFASRSAFFCMKIQGFIPFKLNSVWLIKPRARVGISIEVSQF